MTLFVCLRVCVCAFVCYCLVVCSCICAFFVALFVWLLFRLVRGPVVCRRGCACLISCNFGGYVVRVLACFMVCCV